MQTHPFFTDILMHTDDELAQTLGAGIVERQTIHEWPLSCVQRLLLDNGTKLIYKSQLPPTVEPEFYACASSPLLLGHRALGKLENCDTTVIDWTDAPLLRDVAQGGEELLQHGRRVVAQIGQMSGNLPVYRDVGSADAWSAVGEVALDKLGTLIRDGRFKSMDGDAVDRLRIWSASAPVLERITDCPRVIHGDLTAEQVFVTDEGYRVIDWQRPVVGPAEVDLVTLLVSQRLNPRAHLDAAVVGIYWFLHLCWAVEAQFDLFPDFRGPLFNQWSAEAITHILEWLGTTRVLAASPWLPRRDTMEYCTNCRAVRPTRKSSRRRSVRLADGTTKNVIVDSYHCARCNHFVGSVERDAAPERTAPAGEAPAAAAEEAVDVEAA